MGLSGDTVDEVGLVGELLTLGVDLCRLIIFSLLIVTNDCDLW